MFVHEQWAHHRQQVSFTTTAQSDHGQRLPLSIKPRPCYELSGSPKYSFVVHKADMTSVIRRVPCQLGKLPLARPSSTLAFGIKPATPLHSVTFTAKTVPILSTSRCFLRHFSASTTTRQDQYDEKAQKLNQRGLDEEEQEVRVKQNQIKRPWLREGADKPPAEQEVPQNPNAKGRTHPSSCYSCLVPASRQFADRL